MDISRIDSINEYLNLQTLKKYSFFLFILYDCMYFGR